jgi:hypothetical protein
LHRLYEHSTHWTRGFIRCQKRKLDLDQRPVLMDINIQLPQDVKNIARDLFIQPKTTIQQYSEEVMAELLRTKPGMESHNINIDQHRNLVDMSNLYI